MKKLFILFISLTTTLLFSMKMELLPLEDLKSQKVVSNVTVCKKCNVKKYSGGMIILGCDSDKH